MKSSSARAFRRPSRLTWWAAACASIAAITGIFFATQSIARAAQPPVGLGTATSFAVLAGSTVTNTGPSTITGDVGVSPGTAVTGFPPGQVTGSIHAGDAAAIQAQSDLTTAYDDAAGRTPATIVKGDVGGRTLAAGVYKSTSALGLSGTLTLDAHGNTGAVFIFQVASTLITGSSSRVRLSHGAQACNIFWQVGSSATLGSDSAFAGSILALTSISMTTGAALDGRALARNGAVTLDDNTITAPGCVTTSPTPTPTTTATSTTPPATPTATTTATPTGTATATSTATPTAPVTGTATPTAPVTGTATPTATPTGTPTPTATPTSTRTAPATPTPTPTPVQTGTPAPTPTPVTTSIAVTG